MLFSLHVFFGNHGVGEELGKEDMKWRQVLTDEGERWMS